MKKLTSVKKSKSAMKQQTITKDNREVERQMQKLESALKELQTDQTQCVVEYTAKDLIGKLILDLTEYDTSFLKDYYNMLLSNDMTAIDKVTYDIVWCIQRSLRQRRSTGVPFSEGETVTLAAWLSAATVWTAPRVHDAGRTFQTLLTTMRREEMQRIAEMWWRTVDPDALLELAVVARAPPAPRALDDMLLRAALHRLAPNGGAPLWTKGALRATELEAAAGAVGASLQLLRVAVRVLATDSSKSLLSCLARLSRAYVASGSCDRLQVCVGVSKFNMLFGEGEEDSLTFDRRRKRDESHEDDANNRRKRLRN